MESTNLLTINPQHHPARRALFTALWWQRTRDIDRPLALLAVFLLAFRVDRSLGILIAGAVGVALVGALTQRFSYRNTRGASTTYREQLSAQPPLATLRKRTFPAVWALGAAGIVTALVVRDAAAVRWLVVAFGALIIVAALNSTLWQLSFPATASRVGAFSGERDPLRRLATQRLSLWSRVISRCGGAGFVLLLSVNVADARTDALAVMWMGLAAFVAMPLIGWLVVRRFELALLRELSKDVSPHPYYRPPGPIGLVGAVTMATLAAVVFVASLAQWALLPPAYG
ncbi:MAG: hypothetical protein QM622_09155 [Microbacterium sp.]